MKKDSIVEIDKKWFKEHPGETEYQRESTIEEIKIQALHMKMQIKDINIIGYTTVTQIIPGMRKRKVTLMAVWEND